ncbi:hypothetical protein, partial [Aeromonas sp. QDB12]|uniref:hypothetical protein n=1 Tax=Aeromonas sp. QDB12 TaxID=2990483 RepID=UPI0022E297F0
EEGFGDQIMGFTKSSIQVELIWATTPHYALRRLSYCWLLRQTGWKLFPFPALPHYPIRSG